MKFGKIVSISVAKILYTFKTVNVEEVNKIIDKEIVTKFGTK